MLVAPPGSKLRGIFRRAERSGAVSPSRNRAIVLRARTKKSALGEKDLAIRQLESLVGVPNGPTPGTLRVEPEWDSLRDDPRFKKLAASE